jgi:ECF transporter S component (folate family)
MAIMAALSAVLTIFEPYITPELKLYAFDYLPRAIVAIYFGPLAALVTAFVADFIGFLMNPSYGYFFGYALSAMTADFLCAILLYRRDIKVWRVALWRILVIAVVVFGLNSLWNIMWFGVDAAKYFTGARLIRNLVQFPLDVFLVTFVGRYVKRFIVRT